MNLESNNDAKDRKYNSLQANMGTVPMSASLVNCYPTVSCTFKNEVFLTHPRGLHAKAFAPNLAGVKYPGEFRFSPGRSEMIFTTIQQSLRTPCRTPCSLRGFRFTCTFNASRSSSRRKRNYSLSAPTVAKALQHMVKLGMVRETIGKQRHRLSTYHRYLEILNRGTEFPPAIS